MSDQVWAGTFTVLRRARGTRPPRLPRSVWRLAVLQGLAATADWYLLLAVFWEAADHGWSGAQIAVLAVAARLPTFPGGMLGGRAIDRFGPRRMVLVDGVSRLCATGAQAAVELAGHSSYVVIVAASAWCALTTPLSYAAVRSLIPSLVATNELGRANALLSLGDQLPIVLSALIAGPALVFLGPSAFLGPPVLMVAVWVAARWWLPTQRPVQLPAGPGPAGASPWRLPAVVALITLSTSYFFAYGPFQPLLPVLVHGSLGGGAGGYALLRGASGLGAICGLLFAPLLTRFSRPGVVNAVSMVGYGLVLAPVAFAHTVVQAAVLIFLAGIMWGPYSTVEATALQRWVPAGSLGTIFGAQRALVITAIPLGSALGSAALGFATAPTILATSAISCAVIGVVALAFRPIRQQATADVPPPSRP
jgi:MFS family permease